MRGLIIKRLRWDFWEVLLNGPSTRVAALVPFFAYLIIFNDAVLESSAFRNLTNSAETTFFIDPNIRTRLVYFGLVAIGVANLIYRVSRPLVIKQGPQFSNYLTYALRNFTFRDFQQVNDSIQVNGASTLYGEYYDDEWEAFKDEAFWSESGKVSGFSPLTRKAREHVDYTRALERHADVVRSLLLDHYSSGVQTRKTVLSVLVALSLLGYSLLAIPSIDLFLRVLEITVTGV